MRVDDGLDDLPPEVAAAVHRLAREAVTNARRHARGATRRLLDGFAGRLPAGPPAQPAQALTDREEQILEAVARGRTNGEIARESSLAGSTVKTHIAGLMAKIGARNRVEAAMRAYETGRVGGTPR
ncbi:LuxR C-terminal-related transcriptional regulator [Nocardiopsis flavescens]